MTIAGCYPSPGSTIPLGITQPSPRIGGLFGLPVRGSPSGCLFRQSHPGLRLPRKLVEAGRSQLLYQPQCRSGELDQRRYIDPLTRRGKRLEIHRSAGQHVDDPVIVAPLKMVESHADLENALVQASYGASLGAPEQFQRLVLLEVLPTIELLDTFQELQWRRLVAPGFHTQQQGPFSISGTQTT
jgi:hypothetical protein